MVYTAKLEKAGPSDMPIAMTTAYNPTELVLLDEDAMSEISAIETGVNIEKPKP